jgi:hypothetical protein
MALKNVSLDVAFRYRWLQPNYNIIEGVNLGVHDANLFNVLFRASYHF